MALDQPSWHELFAKILQFSGTRSSEAADAITVMLKEQFGLKAAAFYSTSPVDNSLVLRAQNGFAGNDIPTPVLKKPSAEDKALSDNRIRVLPDLAASEECKTCPNRSLIKKYGLTSAVLVPLLLTERFQNLEGHTQGMGVLCLYPNDPRDAERLIIWMETIRRTLSIAYCNSVERDKLEIREDIVERAINSPDINSFLHRVLQILCDEWAFEAASVFVEDEQSGFLRLHATTGLIGHPQKKDVFYKPDDTKQMTVICFQQMREIVLADPDTAHQFGKFTEETMFPKQAAGWFPIRHPPSTTAPVQKMLGVLRVANKMHTSTERKATVSFSWEDVHLLRFVAEIIGIIAFLFERATKKSENFQRVTHGIGNYLGSAVKNLNQLNERANVEKLLAPRFRYNISNALASLEAIEWQIDKFTAWDEAIQLEIGEIRPYAEVLAKVIAAAHKVARSMNITQLDITKLSEAGFPTIPTVSGNAKALILVFKNLIENSLKYSILGGRCKVDIEYTATAGKVSIFVRDYGIGVLDSQQKWVFMEGFRGDNAMARNPVGTGLGLAQSKTLMKAMGGDLRLENLSEPTTFVVEMLKWEKHK